MYRSIVAKAAVITATATTPFPAATRGSTATGTPLPAFTPAKPWSLEVAATSSTPFGQLGLVELLVFACCIAGLLALLAAAGFTIICIVGVFAHDRRQRRAAWNQRKGKGVADELSYRDVADKGDDGDLDEMRRAAAEEADRDAEAARTTVLSSSRRPSGLLALGFVLLALVFRLALVTTSFAATGIIRVEALASPTFARLAYLAGLDRRWHTVRAQVFFEYGSVATFFVAMVVVARHFRPRSRGYRVTSAAAAADALVCATGLGLWLASWVAVLENVSPDPNRPYMFWAVIMAVRQVADLHLALMVWTLIAAVYVSAVLITKLALSARRGHSIDPASRIILATFAAVAVPSMLGLTVVYMCWGLVLRTDDWQHVRVESRMGNLRLIFEYLTEPGELMMLTLAAWSVRKLQLQGRRA